MVLPKGLQSHGIRSNPGKLGQTKTTNAILRTTEEAAEKSAVEEEDLQYTLIDRSQMACMACAYDTKFSTSMTMKWRRYTISSPATCQNPFHS